MLKISLSQFINKESEETNNDLLANSTLCSEIVNESK